jgi:hypothetical protein
LATFGGAAQSIPGGISFGGSRTDKGCDSRATAQQFALLLGNRLAAAKILCTTKAAKRAHLTMEDCLAIPAPVPFTSTTVPIVSTPAPQPIQVTVNVPESKLVYLTAPQEITVVAPKPLGNVRPATKKHVNKPCIVPKALTTPMEK